MANKSTAPKKGKGEKKSKPTPPLSEGAQPTPPPAKDYIEINDPEETIIIPAKADESNVGSEKPASAEEVKMPDFEKDPKAFLVEPDGKLFKVTAKHCVVWLDQKQMDNNEIYRAIDNPVKYRKR